MCCGFRPAMKAQSEGDLSTLIQVGIQALVLPTRLYFQAGADGKAGVEPALKLLHSSFVTYHPLNG